MERMRDELGLMVLRSLPQAHQRYLSQEIRRMCCDYLRSNRISTQEISPEELLSEVWLKLLGTVPPPNEATHATNWTENAEIPELDGRVVWLIRQIGGSIAIAHRHVDILRQRFGRSRTAFQVEADEDVFEVTSSQDGGGTLGQADARNIWIGLQKLASREFGPDEDVAKLLTVLARVPDVFDECGGRQWPVSRIVALLNAHFPPPDWTYHRVDDAKKRLRNWIVRLQRQNAFDATDLEALFARAGRLRESKPGSDHVQPQYPAGRRYS